MKLFVNDTPVAIIALEDAPPATEFEITIDARQHSLDEAALRDDVLVTYASDTYIKHCLDVFDKKRVRKLDSITFAVEDRRATVDAIKRQFKIIEAAGGVVQKQGKILMIYRLDKWDLPKGKLEKKETPKEGGLREVEEECCVRVVAHHKVCHTWHTYQRHGRKILKKTYWYAMDCLDDSEMTPQLEESITDVRWMTREEARQALYNSYFSIRYVLRQYYEQQAGS